jgi:hypothetical protein
MFVIVRSLSRNFVRLLENPEKKMEADKLQEQKCNMS